MGKWVRHRGESECPSRLGGEKPGGRAAVTEIHLRLAWSARLTAARAGQCRGPWRPGCGAMRAELERGVTKASPNSQLGEREGARQAALKPIVSSKIKSRLQARERAAEGSASGKRPGLPHTHPARVA
ncbi:hypothetical protein SRHO_G00268670 [Serrasalmus rhombeus]